MINILQNRFESNLQCHPSLEWKKIEDRLVKMPHKLLSLEKMEQSGGEPDVVDFDKETGEYLFFDCSAESPEGRRSLCYDQLALDYRKENKPRGSAGEMAKSMGTELLTEMQYLFLQTLGNFDTKTSSWIKTPAEIRELGGAIFGDKRYNHVFIYHNGADSYYASRGFRCCLRV